MPDFDDPRVRHLRLPRRYEYVNNQVCPVVFGSDYSAEVAHRLSVEVIRFLNRVDVGESGIGRIHRLRLAEDPDRERRMDWSYVSYERWPIDRPHTAKANARDVVPDVAAEVVSPNDSADELLARVREYLRSGVRLVWVVYPLSQEVHAYWSGANTIRVYGTGDELDVGNILPGLRTPVGPLFPPVAPT